MRVFKAGLLTVAAAFVGIAGVATPAQAATGWDRCEAGYFCAFTGPNGTGVIAQYKVGDPDLSDGIGPTGMDDNIESIWNRTGSMWAVHRQIGGQEGWAMGAGAKLGYLGDFANRISVITRY
jgi:Peptidase inhibitor family I36